MPINRLKERICQRYEKMLLCRKIRLWQVPAFIRLDRECCRIIHLKAFRADRCVSKEQYLSDLTFVEIELLEAELDGDAELQVRLQRIYDQMERNLRLFDTHDPRSFH